MVEQKNSVTVIFRSRETIHRQDVINRLSDAHRRGEISEATLAFAVLKAVGIMGKGWRLGMQVYGYGNPDARFVYPDEEKPIEETKNE